MRSSLALRFSTTLQKATRTHVMSSSLSAKMQDEKRRMREFGTILRHFAYVIGPYQHNVSACLSKTRIGKEHEVEFAMISSCSPKKHMLNFHAQRLSAKSTHWRGT